MRSVVLTGRLHGSKFRLSGILSGFVLAAVLFWSPLASAINVGGPSDCNDNNAIINCGVHSTSELMTKYNNSAYVRGVYSYFGITNADMANLPATNVAGYVTKNGDVFVDGRSQAVATNAVTGGQQFMPGSTRANHQGAVFYVRPPSVSFQQNSLPAFVSVKNGTFQFAVIASCGNAVKATPTPKAVTPAPTKPVKTPSVSTPPPKRAPPAPSQVQQQSQNQSVNITNTNTQNVTTGSPPPPQTPVASTSSQPATQPTSLVNTGPTGTIGIFLASVALGAFAYRRFLVRRIGM